MNVLCLLFGLLCAGEPATMQVQAPPKMAVAAMAVPTLNAAPMAMPAMERTDPFPADCPAQPPQKLRRHYVQAAMRYPSGADACRLARQGRAECEQCWVLDRYDIASPAGAVGVAQFLPPTAEEWGVDPRDARSSIFGQARYLRWCRARFARQHGRDPRYDIPRLGLGCYNWGLGNMRKDQARNGWALYDEAAPHLPQETRDYVKKIEGPS